MVRSSSSAFFERGPALLIPVFDSRFIPLGRSLNRLLPTPARLTQQSTHMITVITHPKGAQDDRGDTARGPDIPTKAVGFSSPGSQRWNLGFLFWG